MKRPLLKSFRLKNKPWGQLNLKTMLVHLNPKLSSLLESMQQDKPDIGLSVATENILGKST